MSFRFFRRFFYEIHLWLGIASGVILFLVCLSGTIYVFREEAQHLAEPTKYYVEVPQNAMQLSADELIAKVEAAKPGMKVASITIPEKANRTVTMNLSSPGQEGGRGGHGGGRGGGLQRGEHGGRGGGRGGPRMEGERGPRGEGGEGMQRAGRGPRPDGERPEGGRGGRGGRNPEAAMPSGAETAATEPGARSGGPQGGQRGGGGGHGSRGRNAVYVNPYTGDIVGEGGNVVDPFFMSMFTLHRFLWFSGEWRWVGKMIVGVATLVFVVICLTGIVLWLPKTWNGFKRWDIWKIGLRVRMRKGTWAFLYDTHNTIGFYLLIPTLLLALTGLCWSFSWYRDGTSWLLGDRVFKQRMQRPEKIEPLDGSDVDISKPFSVSEIIARQNGLTPGPGEISVSIPQDNETAMVIQKGRTGFFALAIKDKTQWDRFRGTAIPVEHHGKMVLTERFAEKPLGAQMAAAIRAIHFGNITGLSSKIFFFIVCLFATSWPITGVALWIRKLRAKYKKRNAGKEAAGRSGTIQAVSHHLPTEEVAANVNQTV